MDNITRESIDNLIALTRLQCSEEEIEKLVSNLQKVVGFVNELDEADTSSVCKMTYIFDDLKLPTREDKVEKGLDQESFLEKNAPSYIGGLIRVPPVRD